MKRLALILVSVLFLISCNSKTPQCNKKVSPGDVWYKNDIYTESSNFYDDTTQINNSLKNAGYRLLQTLKKTEGSRLVKNRQ